MGMAVGANLVARYQHVVHQLRIPRGDPADDEKSGADLRAVEEIQNAARGEFNPRRQSIPLLGPERGDTAHVKPFFEIDGENVLRIAHAELLARSLVM